MDIAKLLRKRLSMDSFLLVGRGKRSQACTNVYVGHDHNMVDLKTRTY